MERSNLIGGVVLGAVLATGDVALADATTSGQRDLFVSGAFETLEEDGCHLSRVSVFAQRTVLDGSASTFLYAQVDRVDLCTWEFESYSGFATEGLAGDLREASLDVTVPVFGGPGVGETVAIDATVAYTLASCYQGVYLLHADHDGLRALVRSNGKNCEGTLAGSATFRGVAIPPSAEVASISDGQATRVEITGGGL